MANEQYPSLELPKPVVGASEQSGGAPEKAGLSSEQGANQANIQAAGPQTTSVAVPDSSAIGLPLDGSSQSVAAAMAKLPADDLDLIEREWVDRAKGIVTKTQNDPRVQKDQISKLSADYQKERFKLETKSEDPVSK